MRFGQREHDPGQATVELALVMPLIIGLLLIILNVGLVVRDQLAVWHAASAGARAASGWHGGRDRAPH